MHTLERLFQRDSSIVSRKIVDEIILVPTRRDLGEVEAIYALNEVAARIWELLDGRNSLNALRDAIVKEFEVSQTEAQEDLLILIDQFHQIGAIQKVG